MGSDFDIIGYLSNTQDIEGFGEKLRLYATNKTDNNGNTVYIYQSDLNDILQLDNSTQLYKLYNLKSKSSNYQKFKTGGLVNYTGPAWVDGTPTKPEAFLSAKDTELIASLRDVLGSVFRGTSIPSSAIQKSGDTYYEIHINVDELGDGYSVEDLMEEMEERIIQVAGNNAVVKINR
jgi:hypothetical protein